MFVRNWPFYSLTPFGEHNEDVSEASNDNDVDDEDETLRRYFGQFKDQFKLKPVASQEEILSLIANGTVSNGEPSSNFFSNNHLKQKITFIS